MSEAGIYFIQGAHELTRIAHFKDPRRRLSEMQIASPVPLRVVAKITQDEERIAAIDRLHLQDTAADCARPQDHLSLVSLAQIIRAHCTSSHIRGEWYALEDSRLDYLESVVLRAPLRQHLQAVRNATTVWTAVRYAHQVASANDHCDKNVWDADVIGKYIIDWLVCHSKGDLSVLLEFDAQVEALKDALREVGQENRLVPSIDTYEICPWLVTQGEAIFSAVLSMPPLLGVLECVSETYCCFEEQLASNAMCTLLKSTRWDDHDALYWFADRINEGACIESYKEWDVSRLLDGIDATERKSKG